MCLLFLHRYLKYKFPSKHSFSSLHKIWYATLHDLSVKMGFYYLFIYLFEREQVAEGQRGGVEDPKRALRWQQRTWCGAWTYKPWDHDLSQSQTLHQLSRSGSPLSVEMFWNYLCFIRDWLRSLLFNFQIFGDFLNIFCYWFLI